MRSADIELTVESAERGAFTASLRAELPNRRAQLVAPSPVALDLERLRSLALDPAAYGAALSTMLFNPPMREGWNRARGFQEAAGLPIRLRLVIQGDDALHAIHWELLRDPLDGAPLACNQRVLFSRFLSSSGLSDIQAPARPELRAVVAVASPPALPPGTAPIDITAEVARAKLGLGQIGYTLLDNRGGRPPATLGAIVAALREGSQILYLVCHGALVEGLPYLWLEREADEPPTPVAGAALVEEIASWTVTRCSSSSPRVRARATPTPFWPPSARSSPAPGSAP